MAGELDLLQQAYHASLRQLQTLLDAQARLRSVAEQAALETRKEMERLAEALCPEMVDGIRKQEPLGLSEIAAQALADAIVHDVQRRLSRLNTAEAAGHSLGQQYDEALAEAARLRQENAHLRNELASMQQGKEQVDLHAAVLQQALEDAERRLALVPDPAAHQARDHSLATPTEAGGPAFPPTTKPPEWTLDWQNSPSFERDLALLRALAETGLARRDDVIKVLSSRDCPAITPGSMERLLQRCAGRLGLIEMIEAGAGNGNRGPHLVRLTGRGQDACRLFLGLEPKPSQATALLARHETPERALLNLEAGDLLRSAGYDVDLFPGQVELAGGRSFTPDLTASLPSQTLCVKVEQERRNEPDERERRWGPYYDATGGRFYVVVPDKTTLDLLKSEILFWAGRRPLSLWIATLDEAHGKRGDDIWVFRRSMAR